MTPWRGGLSISDTILFEIRAGLETLLAAIAAAGARTSERFIEFFTDEVPRK
jgi:hypothetical protein